MKLDDIFESSKYGSPQGGKAKQARATDSKPSIVPPNTGHESKHPMKGKMVGDSVEYTDKNVVDEFQQGNFDDKPEKPNKGKLVTKDGKPVTLPFRTKDFRGDEIIIVDYIPPHKPSSTGRIVTDDGMTYFPGVADLKIIGHQFDIDEGDVIPFKRPSKGYFFRLFGFLEDNAGNQGWVTIGQYQDFEEVKNRAKKLIDGYGIPASAIKPQNLAIFRYEKGAGDRGESIDVKSLGIPKHGEEFAEAKGDIRKALGGAALAGILGYGAIKGNMDLDQQAYDHSVQLPQLELYLDYAEKQGDQRMIKQLKQRIGDHKMRLSLGKGDVKGRDFQPIEVVYDKQGKAQGPKANEAQEPDADKSSRAKLDHSLRAQGHKVEKDKKKELKKGAVKHKGKLYDHLIALESNTDIPFDKCPKCKGPIFHEDKKKKQDACYHKVKSRYKVWPSAYASGALVKCRKVGAKNWGNKSKKK